MSIPSNRSRRVSAGIFFAEPPGLLGAALQQRLKASRMWATLAIFLLLLILPVDGSAGINDDLPEDDPTIPWHISADEIIYDQTTDQYIAKGNVVISKQDKQLQADKVRFDRKTMEAFADGHVILTTAEDILTGSRMEVDLRTETGTVYDGTIFMKEKHFYLRGAEIQKTGKSTYEARKASFSTCDGESPDWKITGRDVKLEVEGYATVKHAAMWAKKVPVLYTPYFVFPAKRQRQSGLLLPQGGQSDRKGIWYMQPAYWAINESSDATFYNQYMTFRGNQVGLEYRYILDNRSLGTLMFDYLHDRKIDDGEGNASSKWGFEDDRFLRTNKDRYWFRMKHNQTLPGGVFAKLDMDIVSDQDYLLEFKEGLNGFKETEEYFDDIFGRDLDEADDTERLNWLNLNKIWPKYSLNAEVRWFDNVIARKNQEVENKTLQRLPLIEFDAIRQRVLQSPFFFNLASEYVNYYREDGTSGHRVDLLPRFFWPYRYKTYFTLEPSIGLRETLWYIDEYDDLIQQDDDLFSREIFDLRLDLLTEVYNIFPSGLTDVDRIKHTVRPQIVYEFIPDQEQDRAAAVAFDSVDKIERLNLVTYSMTHTFTARSERPRKEDSGGPPDYAYAQFCRFKLQQSFDINEANEDNPEDFLDGRNRHPFSPIFGEIDMVLSKYLTLQADFDWSPYELDFLSHNLATSLEDRRGDRLYLEYRFTRRSTVRDTSTGDKVTRNKTRSFYADANLRLTDNLSVYSRFEQNFEDDKTVLQELGFEYVSQCWGIGLGYKEEDEEQRFTFMVSLRGLGELGKKFRGRRISSPLETY